LVSSGFFTQKSHKMFFVFIFIFIFIFYFDETCLFLLVAYFLKYKFIMILKASFKETLKKSCLDNIYMNI
jgi:hypothetical protein